MKKLLIYVCLFFAVLSLYARGIQEELDLLEEKAKTSYAIGMLMGHNFKADNIELDYEAFTEGLRAIMDSRETPISLNEAMELVTAEFERAEERAAEEQRLMQEEFLSNNSVKPGVRVTPSGLQFEIITEGDGEKPAPDSLVKIYYNGTLIDGTEFDNSGAEPAFIPLDRVIDGWLEALQMMSVGSKYRFYMPANLAYGRRGVPGIIPPYATLIFNIELLEILDQETFFREQGFNEPEFEF